jgi:hypothetical protein
VPIAKKSKLDALLAEVRAAPRFDRIELRDRVVSFGEPAISAMVPWLTDGELAGFAVRVIAKAAESDARPAAAKALLGARDGASPAIRGDIDDALARLGIRIPAPVSTTAPEKAPVVLNQNLYEVLVASARAGKTMTYTEAGEIVGLTMRNPHHRRLLGQHLGLISAFEVENGRPMLSAIVVQKGEGRKRPGAGFDQLGEELGLKRAVDDEAAFEARQLDEVLAYWRSAP